MLFLHRPDVENDAGGNLSIKRAQLPLFERISLEKLPLRRGNYRGFPKLKRGRTAPKDTLWVLINFTFLHRPLGQHCIMCAA